MVAVKRQVKRVGVGIAGGIVLIVGLLAIPYPGPGWLIVFSGLAILSTEFAWAQRVLDRARGEYDKWQQWLSRQSIALRLLVLAATGLLVLTTLWLFNVYGMIGDLLGLHAPWLQSPLAFFS